MECDIIPRHLGDRVLNQQEMRIVRDTYGAVVDEIDDRQLSQVEIPLLKNESKQKEINDKVLQANELRYQAYLKEQEAIAIMNDVINNII